MTYATTTLADFAAAVAERTPAPASGSALAVAAALAAALVELTARFSGEDAAEAEQLRARLLELADEDAEAYTAFMSDRNDETRARIVEVPAEIARLATQVAERAEELERAGNPNLVGDATAARLLARAAQQAAARLVELNR